MKANNSPWTILGVEPGATQQEITQAFRKLAMDHHPDKGGCNATFAQINSAYRTLKEKKHIPILSKPDTTLVTVALTLRQQIEGVNDYIVVSKPGAKKELTIKAKIPAGARAGDKFKIVHDGKHYILTIKEKRHDLFTREGFSVTMYHTLDIVTAMCGGTISIMDPCEQQHTVEIKPGTSQDVLVIPEVGLYNRKTKTRGNLYVHVHTEIPAMTPENIEDFITQLRQANDRY